VDLKQVKKKLKLLNLKVGEIVETPLVGAIWKTKNWKITKEFLVWINKEDPEIIGTGFIHREPPFPQIDLEYDFDPFE